MKSNYEPIIGLEIHAELNTNTKMFCGCANDSSEKHPNINICPVCMGHPGTLPVINQDAVKKTIAAGLALNGEIQSFSQFDRKNYFYPDLPKGYQISQYQHPLVSGGHLDIDVRSPGDGEKFPISKIQIPNNDQNSNSKIQNTKRIRIRRVHLEEDTGRLAHSTNLADNRGSDADGRGQLLRESATLVDFNRAGVPLMELVTEPDFRSGEEVKVFGEELQRIFRYIGASNADMEKGELRVEVNISLLQREFPISNFPASANASAGRQFPNDKVLGTKVEIKNINSFKYAADAVDYEIKRQTEILEKGDKVKQETRGWNEVKEETFSQRSKEESHDYRYFPEPDLPPLELIADFVETVRMTLPELPNAKKTRLMGEYGLDGNMADTLIRDKQFAEYFEEVVSELKEWESSRRAGKDLRTFAKLAANYLTSDFVKLLNETASSVADTLVTAENFAELVAYIAEEKVSSSAAKKILDEMFRTGADPSVIADERGLWQVSSESELLATVEKVISENPEPVSEFRKGKEGVLQFLVGQAIKHLKGRANPQVLQKLFKEKLK